MEKNFNLYQVIAKCSDGDVMIIKDGESAFNICKAKAIQADFEKVGNEIQLKQLDKEETKEIIKDKDIQKNDPVAFAKNVEQFISDGFKHDDYFQLTNSDFKEINVNKIFDVNNGSIATTEYITKDCTYVEIEDDFIEITTNGSFHYKLSSDGDTFIYADDGCSFSIDDATFAITLLQFISDYFWIILK